MCGREGGGVLLGVGGVGPALIDAVHLIGGGGSGGGGGGGGVSLHGVGARRGLTPAGGKGKGSEGTTQATNKEGS